MSSIFDDKRILIVDDEPDVRYLCRDILELYSDSLTILEAKNGQEALEIVKSQALDAILSDVMMPVMDGATFVTELRLRYRDRYTPLAILTAYSSNSLNVDLLESGADAFIKKPMSPELLVATVHSLLRMRANFGALENRIQTLERNLRDLEQSLRDRYGTKTADEIFNSCNVDAF